VIVLKKYIPYKPHKERRDTLRRKLATSFAAALFMLFGVAACGGEQEQTKQAQEEQQQQVEQLEERIAEQEVPAGRVPVQEDTQEQGEEQEIPAGRVPPQDTQEEEP
jgi:hypothetical protein